MAASEGESPRPAPHTPGPWEAGDDDAETVVVEALRSTPRGVMVEREVCHVLTDPEAIETDRANLRLIAAAPDLLAACEVAIGALKAVLAELLQRLAAAERQAAEWQEKALAADAARNSEHRQRFRVNVATELLASAVWDNNENISTDENIRRNCRAQLAIADLLLEEAGL